MRWIDTWWRRVTWVARDLVLCARGFGRAIRHVWRADEPTAIALLAGGPWAAPGRPNAYRVRLVNDAPEPRRVALEVRGESGATRFSTRAGCTLPAHGAQELYVVTDWTRSFELTPDAPAAEAVAFPGAGPAHGTCRLDATLEAAGRPVHRLAIAQPSA